MSSTRIKVGIRLRPFVEWEKQLGYKNKWIKVDENTNEIQVMEEGKNRNRQFKFDYVFNSQTDQQQVYDRCNVDFLLKKVVEGYHCTLLAYGQTGSGKTHTMEGYEYEVKEEMGGRNPPEKPTPKEYQEAERFGIIPRAVNGLFQKLREKNGFEFNVSCSFLQIYNERIYDLLNPNSDEATGKSGQPGLRLRWNQREQFQVENLFLFECKDAKEVMAHFNKGILNRVTASHKLNIASSRSHSIFTIRVEIFNQQTQTSSFSKLQLVDLAGSERIKQTGSIGKLAKESIDINKSLFVLRQVINTLSEIHQSDLNSGRQSDQQYHHIPYRDSKLTSLLKQSIGGNSFCLMIACINPSDLYLEENISTLNYAKKATHINNEPILNDDPKNIIIREADEENKRLRQELDKANKHIALLSSLNVNPDASEGTINFGYQHPPNCCLPSCPYKTAKREDQVQRRYAHEGILTIDNEKETLFSANNQVLQTSPNLQAEFHENAIAQLNHAAEIQRQQKQQLLKKISALQAENYQLHQKKSSDQPYFEQSGSQLSNPENADENKGGDFTYFSDRLIESITMVRELLVSNKELRETTDQTILKSREQEKELYHLQKENEDLRYRLQQANNNKVKSYNNNDEGLNPINMNTRTKINEELPASSEWQKMSKKDLIEEILTLRCDKKILERKTFGRFERPVVSGSLQQETLMDFGIPSNKQSPLKRIRPQPVPMTAIDQLEAVNNRKSCHTSNSNATNYSNYSVYTHPFQTELENPMTNFGKNTFYKSKQPTHSTNASFTISEGTPSRVSNYSYNNPLQSRVQTSIQTTGQINLPALGQESPTKQFSNVTQPLQQPEDYHMFNRPNRLFSSNFKSTRSNSNRQHMSQMYSSNGQPFNSHSPDSQKFQFNSQSFHS